MSGPDTLRERIVLGGPVVDALASGRPLVALESALISHGLPYPANLEVASAAEAAVRESGALPATIAVRDGRILIGLSGDEIEALASAGRDHVRKASRPTLAAALSAGGWAGTTVSATMIAAHAAGIPVFATGGIGGVHPGALSGDASSFDVSSDLEELARTPVVVVCAGPKAIIDVRATVEYLETRGVPVLTVGLDEIPGFFIRKSGVASPMSLPSLEAAAQVARTHLGLALGSGMVVCVPVPEGDAVSDDVARDAIQRARREAEEQQIYGPTLTPWLLSRIGELTNGASIRANRALIENNAGVAGELAARLAGSA